MLFFESWCYDWLVGAEDVDVWKRTDNELSETYDRWAKHATGAIEVIFGVQGAKRLGGYRGDLKIYFPRFSEKATITVTC